MSAASAPASLSFSRSSSSVKNPFARRGAEVAARAATSAPLLAKGFFTEELDLLKDKLAGADAALILLRDVDDARAASLVSYARELGIETLVEAHDADELQRAVALEAEVIGVNALDLTTFEIDRKAQLEL